MKAETFQEVCEILSFSTSPAVRNISKIRPSAHFSANLTAAGKKYEADSAAVSMISAIFPLKENDL